MSQRMRYDVDSRSRDNYRSRETGKHEERRRSDRKRRRSRSRSRESSKRYRRDDLRERRSRDRRRDSSRERGYDRHRRRSPERDRRSKRSSERRRRRSRSPQKPTEFVLVEDLPSGCTESKLQIAFRWYNPVNIEVFLDDPVKASYAVAEFRTLAEAQKIVEDNDFAPGVFNLDGTTVTLSYTKEPKMTKPCWLCEHCWYYNIHHVTSCAQCSHSQTSGSVLVSKSGNPCVLGKTTVSRSGKEINLRSRAVLILSGLNHDTTESSLTRAFKGIEIKGIHMIKRSLETNAKSIGFLQFYTESEASVAFRQAIGQDLRIDDTRITSVLPQIDPRVLQIEKPRKSSSRKEGSDQKIPDNLLENLKGQIEWTKNAQQATKSSPRLRSATPSNANLIKNPNAKNADGPDGSPKTLVYTAPDTKDPKEQIAMIRKALAKHKTAKATKSINTQSQSNSNSVIDGQMANSAPIDNMMNMQQFTKKKHSENDTIPPLIPTGTTPTAVQYGIAEVFKWDPECNCFYDPNSGYYFDIHRKLYYYDYVYYDWNETEQKYISVPDPDLTKEQNGKTELNDPQKQHVAQKKAVPLQLEKKDDKPIKMVFMKQKLSDQVKNMKMQKLQRQIQVAQAEVRKSKEVFKQPSPVLAPVNKKVKRKKKEKKVDTEQGYIDFQKLRCLLCRRRFTTREMLEKHELQSKLHKKNVIERQKQNKNKQKKR